MEEDFDNFPEIQCIFGLLQPATNIHIWFNKFSISIKAFLLT